MSLEIAFSSSSSGNVRTSLDKTEFKGISPSHTQSVGFSAAATASIIRNIA
eukprot:gene5738-7321_t